MLSFVIKKSDNHCRNTFLRYSMYEMHAAQITRLQKNLKNINSLFRERMQALRNEINMQDEILNEMEEKWNLVMEHLKAKEDIYTPIKVKLDVSNRNLIYIEKEREKTLPDLYHFYSDQQTKTEDMLAVIHSSGLSKSAKKPSAWKKTEIAFPVKITTYRRA